jgi:spermidine/putrescine transport system permease protein
VVEPEPSGATLSASLAVSRGRPSWLSLGPGLLTLPAIVGLVGFFAIPTGVFFVYSFLTSGFFSVGRPLTTDNYLHAVESHLNRTLALNSLETGALTAAVTVAIGLPVAYWLRYRAGRWQLPVFFLITASMFTGYLVRVYAWRVVLGRDGLLNGALRSLGIVDQPLGFLLFSRTAVTIALVQLFAPFVVILLFAGFRPLEPRYLECAEDLGASSVTRWRRVVAPLMLSPCLTAFMLVFLLAASDFVTPMLLGGRTGSLLGVRIESTFLETGEWGLGAALSFLTLASFVLMYLLSLVVTRVTGLGRIRWET